MTDLLLESLRESLAGDVRAAEPMALHTTWRVGGNADYFIAPASREEVAAALALFEENQVPWVVVGAGSNLLVRDGGIRGAVLHLGRLQDLVFEEKGRVRAEGGLSLMALIREAIRRGLGGLEELAGIPGSVGGGLAMNVGAGSQTIGRCVVSAVVADATGETMWDRQRLSFAYRSSALTSKTVVLEAVLQLEKDDKATLKERFDECLRKKNAAHGIGFPNAGSVFKNPPGESAWRLIDAAGLRGRRVGDAEISMRHANFIVNKGKATARDIFSLMEEVVETVRKESGIELEPEVRIVGED